MKVSVVIPVYNERATIGEVVRRVAAAPMGEGVTGREVVIVDDCSTDGTLDAIDALSDAAGLVVIRQDRNRGKGAALRAGFAQAAGDVVVVQDADLEYDPADLYAVLAPIIAGRADVVYGSRFADRSRSAPRGRGNRAHRLANRLLTALSNLTTGLRLTDMETCYKAARRDVLSRITIEEDRFGVEPEITAKFAALNCRVQEVAIGYAGRTYAEGKKITWRDGVRAVWCIVKYGVLRRGHGTR
ncbi:MAG: glycosyltransferase family 2 protein [Phycisphaeraceae bacterium]|nr:glycosyltransferase family 2 protein [Phycisphaeraceae bacterium]